MKKLCLLLVFLTLLLCSCLPNDFFLSSTPTTNDTTTTDVTTPEETAHEHIFKTEVFVEPTCEKPGLKREVCACGTMIETNFDVTGEHNYQPPVTTKEPTCAEVGEKVETCLSCGHKKTASIPATGKHLWNAITTKVPTCVEDGEQTVSCTTCSATQKLSIPATGVHIWGEAVITKEPTCSEDGEQTVSCTTCTAAEKTVIPATDLHIYTNGICSSCGFSPIPIYASPSIYDADGDGKTDTYNFSPELLDGYQKGVHVWAGDFDKSASSAAGPVTEEGHEHWYVVEYTSDHLIYSVNVPEAGVYEMIVHLRLKDAKVRGTKYTVNGGSDHEQVFQTSYGYSGMNYAQMRNEENGIYMYGITVNLVAGENTIKIEHTFSCEKSQHYRDFYFVKIGEYHAHTYKNETILKQANCGEDGEKLVTCPCGESKSIVIPATNNHIYVDDVCSECGKVYVPAGILEYDFLYDCRYRGICAADPQYQQPVCRN